MKGRKENYFVIITTVAFTVFLGIMLFNIFEIKNTLSRENKNVTGKNTLVASFESGTFDEQVKILNKLADLGFIIRNSTVDGFEYRSDKTFGLYSKNEIHSDATIETGRFLTMEDIQSSKPVVVVGKEVYKHCREKEGKKFLIRGDKEFEVIGVISEQGENIDTLEDIILYNLKAVLSEDEKFPIYEFAWYLDNVDLGFEEMINKAKSIGDERLVVSKAGERYSEIVYSVASDLENNKLLLIVLFCIVISMIRAIVYWIEGRKLEIGVRQAFGASKKEITKEIIKEYIKMLGISMVVSLIIQLALVKSKVLGIIKYSFNLEIFINSILIVGIIMLITIPIIRKLIDKVSIGKALKMED